MSLPKREWKCANLGGIEELGVADMPSRRRVISDWSLDVRCYCGYGEIRRLVRLFTGPVSALGRRIIVGVLGVISGPLGSGFF